MSKSKVEELQMLAARAAYNAEDAKKNGHPFVAAVCDNARKDYAKEALKEQKRG